MKSGIRGVQIKGGRYYFVTADGSAGGLQRPGCVQVGSEWCR
jgi:hypothetical protein